MDVEYKGKDTIIHNLKDFDLGQTMECGQCFHFQKIDDDEYGMSAYGKFLHAAQKDDKMYLFDTTKEEFEKIWCHYFDLIRISVGIEDIEDLIDDFKQAIESVKDVY